MTEISVSVITPAFNSGNLLAEAIESVRNQTLKEWEHCIIDDGSTDDTREIARRYATLDCRIKILVNETNHGPAAARNLGIQAARGRYIAFLDGDDLWLPGKLERQVAFMERSGCALSFTGYEQIDVSGNVLGEVKGPAEITERDLTFSNQIACSTAMYDRQVLGAMSMPLIAMRQDWGLWLAIARKGFVAKNVGAMLAQYRIRPGSVSGNKLRSLIHTWRFLRDVAEVPLHKRLHRMVVYAAVSAKKYRGAMRALSGR